MDHDVDKLFLNCKAYLEEVADHLGLESEKSIDDWIRIYEYLLQLDKLDNPR